MGPPLCMTRTGCTVTSLLSTYYTAVLGKMQSWPSALAHVVESSSVGIGGQGNGWRKKYEPWDMGCVRTLWMVKTEDSSASEKVVFSQPLTVLMKHTCKNLRMDVIFYLACNTILDIKPELWDKCLVWSLAEPCNCLPWIVDGVMLWPSESLTAGWGWWFISALLQSNYSGHLGSLLFP